MKKKAFTYKIVVLKDKVLAISTFAGKTVKGVATCSPDDIFDADKGAELAAARCNKKVAKKRVRHAEKKLAEALRIRFEADEYVKKMTDYVMASKAELVDAEDDLEKIIKGM